jgi:hypothetical protein
MPARRVAACCGVLRRAAACCGVLRPKRTNDCTRKPTAPRSVARARLTLTRMLDERRSGRLVAWGNAWFAGHTSLDEAAARTCGTDFPHRVTGLPGEDAPVGLTVALGRLRGLGANGLRLALPVPGDPLGLPGPPPFNELATEAAEAVLCASGAEPLGLVPEVRTYGPEGDRGVEVLWRVHPVNPGRGVDVPALAEAERKLADALRSTTDALAQMDVARWRPEAAAAIDAIRSHGRDADGGLAPGYPARAHRVLALAQRLGAITALAHGDAGAAVSATEMAARAAVLRPLERSSRRAQLAAYNAIGEPSREGEH